MIHPLNSLISDNFCPNYKVCVLFLMDSVELGNAPFLFWPKVDVNKVHVSGGLEVAAVVATVAIPGHNGVLRVLRVVLNGSGNAKISYSMLVVLLFSHHLPKGLMRRCSKKISPTRSLSFGWVPGWHPRTTALDSID